MSGRSKPNEIRITRVYDAPVADVWDAWTDPAKAANWWGPRGFTLTTHRKDLRVGGSWVYTMHGPDGTDYPNRTAYLEVVPREILEAMTGDDQLAALAVDVREVRLGGDDAFEARIRA